MQIGSDVCLDEDNVPICEIYHQKIAWLLKKCEVVRPSELDACKSLLKETLINTGKMHTFFPFSLS